MKLQSIRAIAKGVALVARDPRLLAELVSTQKRKKKEASFVSEVLELLGGAPRTVPIERIIASDALHLPLIGFLDDTSPVLDLLLLRSLVSRFEHGRFLEVGTFRGESAVTVAGVAGEVVTISLPDERMVELGLDPSFILAHRTFSEGNPQIRHILEDSQTMDLTEFEGWADVIFIDGDHSRDAVESDTRRFWSVRRCEKSIFIWHDAFYSTTKPRWEVLAGIAAGLPPEYRGGLVHISNTLAVAWLPDASMLPTIDCSYVPRVAFSLQVMIRQDWNSPRIARHGLKSP